MRTVPCNCSGGQSNTVCWEHWKRPLTFIAVLLALAFALSQFFGRFLQVDSGGNVIAEMRSLHGKINQINQHLDNLALLQLELDRKLKGMCDSDIGCKKDKNEKKNESTTCAALIEDTVKKAIATYDADEIGLADFALGSAGGAVISTPDTETYTVGMDPITIFGIPLCYQKNTPQEIIKPGSLPGDCWAFKGGRGSAIIRLLGLVNISSVSLEHIPSHISPTGSTHTAPREFSLWGLRCEKDEKPFLLGNFMYVNTKKRVQNFPVQFQCGRPFNHVMVKFLSNYGHPNYTCVYRVRVHGVLVNRSHGLI